jgi:hypothetical protein
MANLVTLMDKVLREIVPYGKLVVEKRPPH